MSLMSEPLVTVILPVYNGERYVRLAIDSVLTQSFTDFELIVIDDGSTDSTASCVEVHDPRVKYVYQENTGVAGAFNRGLGIARGKFISWLSHDDLFHPAKLENQIAALERFGNPGVCYTDADIIDDQGRIISSSDLPEYQSDQLLRNILMASQVLLASYSICYHRVCIDAVGAYSESWRYTQDADMLVRLARKFPFIHVPKKLMQVREHAARGVKSAAWEAEAIRFFGSALATIPFEEVFPEFRGRISRENRARAYTEVGDTFAARPDVLYRVAYSQYRRAIREKPTPAQFLRMLRRMFGLYRYRPSHK
jgi:glycosyltransferase involved in cell wall biosynthesis